MRSPFSSDGAVDRTTIDRARRYDPDAWEALYRRLYPRLLTYARQRLPPSEVDDAISEAFIRAMNGIERFRWRSAGGFDGWVFGILRNVTLEQYRRAQRVRPSAHEDGAANEPVAEQAEQPEARLVARERAATVRAAFEKLEPRDRELLELRVIGGLDATAVAQIVGKRPGAVRMAQARALNHLGAMLRESDP